MIGVRTPLGTSERAQNSWSNDVMGGETDDLNYAPCLCALRGRLEDGLTLEQGHPPLSPVRVHLEPGFGQRRFDLSSLDTIESPDFHRWMSNSADSNPQ